MHDYDIFGRLHHFALWHWDSYYADIARARFYLFIFALFTFVHTTQQSYPFPIETDAGRNTLRQFRQNYPSEVFAEITETLKMHWMERGENNSVNSEWEGLRKSNTSICIMHTHQSNNCTTNVFTRSALVVSINVPWKRQTDQFNVSLARFSI